MKNQRRKFLKNAGSTALFTSLGSTFFISCDDTEEVIDPDNNNTSENGFTVDGDTYTIELDHPNFSILKCRVSKETIEHIKHSTLEE